MRVRGVALMGVYVDVAKRYAREPKGYVGHARMEHRWGHMIADTEAELHAMADAIGLRRAWFQKDHYDLVPSKRALAIRRGAVALDRRTFVEKLTGARERLRSAAGLSAGSSPAASTTIHNEGGTT